MAPFETPSAAGSHFKPAPVVHGLATVHLSAPEPFGGPDLEPSDVFEVFQIGVTSAALAANGVTAAARPSRAARRLVGSADITGADARAGGADTAMLTAGEKAAALAKATEVAKSMANRSRGGELRARLL